MQNIVKIDSFVDFSKTKCLHLFVLAVIMISAQMLGAFVASGILHFSYKAGLNTESALNKSNEACLDSSPVLASAR